MVEEESVCVLYSESFKVRFGHTGAYNWQNVRAYVGVLGKVTGLRTLSSGCQRGGHSSAVAFKTRI